MKIPEPVEEIVRQLIDRNYTVEVDEPDQVKGEWWLDVAGDENDLVMAWKENQGFGVSEPDPYAFGEGHSHTFDTADELLEWLNSRTT